MVEAVKEVFAAEKKAAEIVTQAQAKKEYMISEAKLHAVKLLDEEKKVIEVRLEKELEKKRKGIETEHKRILEESQEQIVKLRKKAQCNIAYAVELVLKELNVT